MNLYARNRYAQIWSTVTPVSLGCPPVVAYCDEEQHGRHFGV